MLIPNLTSCSFYCVSYFRYFFPEENNKQPVDEVRYLLTNNKRLYDRMGIHHSTSFSSFSTLSANCLLIYKNGYIKQISISLPHSPHSIHCYIHYNAIHLPMLHPPKVIVLIRIRIIQHSTRTDLVLVAVIQRISIP